MFPGTILCGGSGLGLGLALIFVWGGALGEGGGLISVFGERSASVGEVFIFAGGWALGYHSMGFQRFPGIS